MTNEDHNHAKCIEMFEKISEYLDQELDEAKIREVERHAAACARCKVCMETLRRTIDLCRNLSPQPTPESLSRNLKTLLNRMMNP